MEKVKREPMYFSGMEVSGICSIHGKTTGTRTTGMGKFELFPLWDLVPGAMKGVMAIAPSQVRAASMDLGLRDPRKDR